MPSLNFVFWQCIRNGTQFHDTLESFESVSGCPDEAMYFWQCIINVTHFHDTWETSESLGDLTLSAWTSIVIRWSIGADEKNLN